jgi:hypothetical protein
MRKSFAVWSIVLVPRVHDHVAAPHRVSSPHDCNGSKRDEKPCPLSRQLSPKAAMGFTGMSTRPRSQAGLPMTLANMRANGVRSLDVCCSQCHHRAIMSADPPDHVPVPMFGPRCGIIGADSRPNWREHRAHGT